MPLVDELAIKGCDDPRYDGLVWHFPCGLQIDGVLNVEHADPLGAAASRDAHQRHHEMGHTERHYQIVVQTESAKAVRAWCTCKR